MSMEARATFLNNLGSKLSTELTLASMNNVMSVVSDIIADFTITQIPKEMEGIDDLYDAYISDMLWRIYTRRYDGMPCML